MGSAVLALMPASTRRARERELRSDLRRALERGEIVPHYQPIVNMRTRRIVRFEALARWPRDGGATPPDQFIPVAERSGLSAPLMRLMITHAIGDARLWRDRLPELRISVNLSAVSLGRRHLPEELVRTITLAGGDPSWLALEITEGALAQDLEGIADHVRRLRSAGVHVEIDDFGIGYSSLGHLRAMNVDSVKIDRRFVARMRQETVSEKIVRFVIDLSHQLGIRAVAEGVESKNVWSHLALAGCDEAQGFFVGRPLPEADVARWIDSWESGPNAKPLGQAS